MRASARSCWDSSSDRPGAGALALTSATIKAKAADAGFDLAGVARADRHPKLGRLADWIAEGRAGEMAYLERTLEERCDPVEVLPSARSVLSLAVVYNTSEPYSVSRTLSGAAKVARYAWGDDYHDVLRERLRVLLGWMQDVAGDGFEAFSCVDTGPVQERVLAEQAGLGWIGKNTCLINPELGSWVFLAEVITNLDLEPDAPGVDQCGACTLCLEACPTGAIVEPYVLDATRCLSYLTIETRADVPAEWRSAIGQHVFGCDICQDVCPWNHEAATSDDAAWQPRGGLAAPRLIDLCRMTDAAWRQVLEGSAMRRAGLRRLRRSLAYAAASLPASESDAALDALAEHPSGADDLVARAIGWARSHRAGSPGRTRR